MTIRAFTCISSIKRLVLFALPVLMLSSAVHSQSKNPASTVLSPIVALLLEESQRAIFVDKNATGSNNGTSWTNAFVSLQDALTKAENSDITEIWVASGVYYPDEGADITNDDPDATFHLLDGVGLYGGFSGFETQRSQANPDHNLTVLSGDIAQDDQNADGNQIAEDITDIEGTNSLNVTTGSGTTDATVIEGFTITAGFAAGVSTRGGGMLNSDGSPTLNRVSFSGNYATDEGGGMANLNDSRPSLNHVLFIGNFGNNGGGGLADLDSSSELSNVRFFSNVGVNAGGGVIGNNSEMTLNNVIFSGNNTTFGGGIHIDNGSQITIVNASFNKNSATLAGGIAVVGSSNVEISNSIFNDNTAISAPTLSITGGSTSIIRFSYFTDAPAGVDLETNKLDQQDPFVDDDGADDTAGTIDDNLQLKPHSRAIDAGDTNLNDSTVDIAGNPRKVDDINVVDTGSLTPPIDMGAYERQIPSPEFLEWTIEKNGTSTIPEYVATGGQGDNGLFVQDSDALANSFWTFKAPDYFYGNISAYEDGLLSYYLKQAQTDAQLAEDDIILTGNGITLSYRFDNPSPGTDWTYYAVRLSHEGWMVGEDSNTDATAQQMQSVLADLTSLEIRGEYRSGADTAGLDNVVLQKGYHSSPGVTIPDNTGSGITDMITVPVATTVNSVKVYVDIAHSFVGDLTINLTKGVDSGPATVFLINNPPSCSSNDVKTIFADDAMILAQPNCDPIGVNQAYMSNTVYQPFGDLSVFDSPADEDVPRTWTIEVIDSDSGAQGMLNSWSVFLK